VRVKLSLQKRDRAIAHVMHLRGRRKNISKRKRQCKHKKTAWLGKRPTERISAPFAFNIHGDQNRATFIKFVTKIRDAVIFRRALVYLDFSKPEVLRPAAVLLFVAELDRMKRIVGNDFAVRIENVRVPRVSQVLQQVGVYDICGGKNLRISEEAFDDSVKHWRYATGVRAGDETNEAFENFEGRLSPELAKGMWKGVSEAVVNSVQHAYVEPRFKSGPRLGHSRWWMFSHEKEGELQVIVCDLGIGIPRSLPLNWEPGLLDRLLSTFTKDGNDVRSIRAALAVGASSTGAPHRGKGLQQIWNTLRNAKGASVAILSNHGQLSWSGVDQKEFALEFGTSINGTMIIWTVEIETDAKEPRPN